MPLTLCAMQEVLLFPAMRPEDAAAEAAAAVGAQAPPAEVKPAAVKQDKPKGQGQGQGKGKQEKAAKGKQEKKKKEEVVREDNDLMYVAALWLIRRVEH